jgi:hypothetical protein
MKPEPPEEPPFPALVTGGGDDLWEPPPPPPHAQELTGVKEKSDSMATAKAMCRMDTFMETSLSLGDAFDKCNSPVLTGKFICGN